MSHSDYLCPRGPVQKQVEAHVAAVGEQNRDKTIAPDTTLQGGQALRPSHLHAPKAPRHIKQENWREGSVESSGGVHDSMAQLAERKKDPKAHLDGDIKGHPGFLGFQEMPNQAKFKEEWIAVLRQDFEERVERFLEENKDIVSVPPKDMAEYFDPSSPERFEHGDLPPHPLSWQSAGPSGLGQEIQEGRNRHPVVVAKRLQNKPCGTVVLDHDTGAEKVVTERYRARKEVLHSPSGLGQIQEGRNHPVVVAKRLQKRSSGTVVLDHDS